MASLISMILADYLTLVKVKSLTGR